MIISRKLENTDKIQCQFMSMVNSAALETLLPEKLYLQKTCNRHHT